MSFDAMRWAMSVRAPSSGAKLLLLVMADLVRAPEHKMYVSAARLSEMSQLDRKTVLANIQRLEVAGLIQQLDEKAPGRGGAPVFRLNLDASASAATDPGIGTGSTGPAADEPNPVFPRTDTAFPANRTQFSREPNPKTGHKPVGTSNEPVRAREREARSPSASFDAGAVELPGWLSRKLWVSWADDRRQRRKPITKAAAEEQIRQLQRMRDEGHDPEAAIRQSIASGWTGLFPPKSEGSHAPARRQTAVERQIATMDALTGHKAARQATGSASARFVAKADVIDVEAHEVPRGGVP